MADSKIDKCYSFRSERLSYRGIEEKDAQVISAWRSVPANYKQFLNPRPLSVEEHLRWFASYLSDETRFDFMICDESGNPIGTAGLSGITADSCEISYMIGSLEARGKGYAKEAVLAMVDLAFNVFGVNEVVARILSNNESSIRVALGAGFSERERIYKLSRD